MRNRLDQSDYQLSDEKVSIDKTPSVLWTIYLVLFDCFRSKFNYPKSQHQSGKYQRQKNMGEHGDTGNFIG